MKEEGGHFIPALACALAAHALLFLFFFWLVSRVPEVPRIAPVEVQFSGSGGGGGGGGGSGGGGAPVAGRTAARGVKPALPAPPPPTAPSPVPAPAPLSQAPSAAAQAHADAGPAAGSAEATGRPGDGGTGGSGGSGEGTGGGTAGDGTAGDWASSPPATIADIDPVPLREISAAYPPSARFLGQQGVVRVQVEVSRDGIVTGESIAKSSGFRLLDNAALEAVKSVRFLPAMKNGKTVAAMVIIPVRFTLSQD